MDTGATGIAARKDSDAQVFFEKKDIPSVKSKVAKAILESGKRFVFFVDDIDRLTPDEARDFFRAVKALGDFPEVVYVLFFDRHEVSKALSSVLKVEGDAYLEKIVQAPFDLPAPNKQQLRTKLFEGLDSIIDAQAQPFEFDQDRWSEVYFGGLDRHVRKPRDIVRILNAISVGYPPLAGEVNPVDFIALEFLRVFEPAVYATIRDEKDLFCGNASGRDRKKEEEQAFFERWQASLPELTRDATVELVGRLFPKVGSLLNSSYLGSIGEAGWRRELRPCSADCFDVYFQFGVPTGYASRAELDRLVGETAEGMASILFQAKDVLHPDGHSKARDLLDRLRDFEEWEPAQAARLIEALTANAHLLLRKQDEPGAFFITQNRWRVGGLIDDLLEALPLKDRQALLSRLAAESPGLWMLVDLADDAMRATRDPTKTSKAFVDLPEGFADALAETVAKRLDAATLSELLAVPELDFVVHRWGLWGGADRIREVFAPMLEDDARLMELFDRFVRTGQMHSGGKTRETYNLSMKPLAAAVDLQAVEPRLRAIATRSDLTKRQSETLQRLFRGLKAMSEGRDPDGMGAFDDDED